MARGFIVQGVEIEGFKGFTSPKTIDFKGRHVFLLGLNGNGKSSIVEAVRWGLFGSTFRTNEIVKNQRYTGNCRVTIKLMRDGEPWTLRRTLDLGTRGRADGILTDQSGTRHLLRDIMPQLDSVNAGEGTHVIFAPQSAPLRRQPEDLDPFERTVFNYLGLTHPRVLLSNIDDFLKEQAEAEHNLDEKLTGVRKNIDDQIADQENRRRRILDAPPWGDGPIPSISASEQKTNNFIREVTGNPPALVGLSLEALLESAAASLEKRRTQQQGSLENEATNLSSRRERLETLHRCQKQVSEQEACVQNCQSELSSVLGDRTPNELYQGLKAVKAQADTESIQGRILQDAIELIGRDESETVSCPICDSNHDRQSLASALQDTVTHPGDSIISSVAELESQLQQYQELKGRLNAQVAELTSLKRDLANAMNLVDDEDKKNLSATSSVQQAIKNHAEREAEIKAQLDNQEEWFRAKQAELDKLNEENRVHRIQGYLSGLYTRKRELERAIASYDNLVSFGESVRATKEAIETCLNEQLAQDIPRVSDILSNAFSALTRHPWYDQLVISESVLPKLQLRVASSQEPGREDPTGVLNGQAESALNLVPYFAFSQTEDTPTEVYLVMLDDPTRALDTEHIRILVERLHELGRNVQLIVASQETERFQEMIPEVFDEAGYVIVEPTGWSPTEGPTLKIRYE